MKTLIQKDLVYEHGRPLRRYALSEEGWEVAKRIQKTLPGASESSTALTGSNPRKQPMQMAPADGNRSLPGDDDDDVVIQALPTGFLGQNSHTDGPTEPITLPPGSFTVELVLDTREVRTQKDRDYIANELIKKGITPQVRALELGDIMWVAKCRDSAYLTRYGEEGDEVMLDWILERKRLDDLIGSIKDGRFHEQKFRLKRSGIKNVIYLIEEFSVTHADAGPGSASKYQEMAASAIASTQVVNGYFLKQTRSLDDSIRYLARMTRLLRKMYGAQDSPGHEPRLSEGGSTSSPNSVAVVPSRRISSIQSYLSLLDDLRAKDPSVTFGVTFSTFSALASKSNTLTLRDVFLKMLMCMRHVTGEKAMAIQRLWPTPRHLVEAYMALEPSERETLMSDKLHSVVGRKTFGKALSKKVAEVWGASG
jgi:crossover junction endonuclease MUS81